MEGEEVMAHKFSVSQLNMYSRCGVAYYYRYIAKVRPPATNHNLVVGSIMHGLLEELLDLKNQYKLEDILLVDIKTVVARIFDIIEFPDVPAEDWQEPGLGYPDLNFDVASILPAGKEIVSLLEDDLVKTGILVLQDRSNEQPGWSQAEISEQQDVLIRLVEAYLYSEIYQESVTDREHIEVQLDFTIDNEAFVGYIDFIDMREEVPTLVDLKSSSKTYAEDRIEKDLQLLVYAYAYNQLYDMWPNIEYQVIVKTKKPKVQVIHLEAEKVQQLWEKIEKRVIALLSGLASGVYLPADPGNWLCSPKWCPYYDQCPYV
jgi:CRISPR/Cas system-associated exonuclease Cas4 (RecB family)